MKLTLKAHPNAFLGILYATAHLDRPPDAGNLTPYPDTSHAKRGPGLSPGTPQADKLCSYPTYASL